MNRLTLVLSTSKSRMFFIWTQLSSPTIWRSEMLASINLKALKQLVLKVTTRMVEWVVKGQLMKAAFQTTDGYLSTITIRIRGRRSGSSRTTIPRLPLKMLRYCLALMEARMHYQLEEQVQLLALLLTLSKTKANLIRWLAILVRWV